jgi:acyl-CoA reductase-like NAD-dependent aldehyde dehydrogenase
MTDLLRSLNPYDGTVVGELEVTPVTQIPERVARARAAGAAWRAMPIEERGGLLLDAATGLAASADANGALISREMGKTLRRGQREARNTAAQIADKVAQATAALVPVIHRGDGVETTVHYDPLGVAAVISPWNYPLAMPADMIIPALVAGNTVVFKPSEETPLCGQAFADALLAVLPDDVLQVVHGEEDQGKALVAADVDLIVFTGSRAAGRHIMAAAADGLKRLILELGGKDALIVMPGADLDAAADYAVANSFENAGQMCVATERVFVHRSLAEAFEARVAARASETICGAPDDDATRIGPMVNARQREHVVRQIQQTIDAGARVLVGGGEHPDRFVQPTVLTDVGETMALACEETFGPVVAITVYDEVEQAVAAANATPYGLGGAVFGPTDEALAVARRLDTGMVGVNRSLFGVGDTPWVGAKQSGFGYLGSPDGWRQFTQPRVISVAT